MKPRLEIVECRTSEEFHLAKQVTQDYVEWLGIDLTFQNIEEEYRNFNQLYSPPEGCYLLAWLGDEMAGGVALRKLEGYICEMKRMYVYPHLQGHGLGRALAREIVSKAKSLGYRRMRLDTLGRLTAAIKLYEQMGFVEIPKYRENPEPGVKYMELSFS